MTDDELTLQVRELRSQGRSPKEIARIVPLDLDTQQRRAFGTTRAGKPLMRGRA